MEDLMTVVLLLIQQVPCSWAERSNILDLHLLVAADESFLNVTAAGKKLALKTTASALVAAAAGVTAVEANLLRTRMLLNQAGELETGMQPI